MGTLNANQVIALHDRVSKHFDLSAVRALIDNKSSYNSLYDLRHPIWNELACPYASGVHLDIGLAQEILLLCKESHAKKEQAPPLERVRQAIIRGALHRKHEPEDFKRFLCALCVPVKSSEISPLIDVVRMACQTSNPTAAHVGLLLLQEDGTKIPLDIARRILLASAYEQSRATHDKEMVQFVARVLEEVTTDIPFSVHDVIKKNVFETINAWAQEDLLVLEGLDVLFRSQEWPTKVAPALTAHREKQKLLEGMGPPKTSPPSGKKVM